MTPRLRHERRAQLPLLVAKGAAAYGYRGDVWTARRVAQLLADTFGVRYHRDHVRRLLRQLGWSRQRPITQATQRDEQAITHWQAERWPALQKRPVRKRPPSSGEMHLHATCCRLERRRGRHVAKHRGLPSSTPKTTSQPSVA